MRFLFRSASAHEFPIWHFVVRAVNGHVALKLEDRVANIFSGSGVSSGANGALFFDDTTVNVSDGEKDELDGGSGADWFIADQAAQHSATEDGSSASIQEPANGQPMRR